MKQEFENILIQKIYFIEYLLSICFYGQSTDFKLISYTYTLYIVNLLQRKQYILGITEICIITLRKI